jgi:hypothetical protein
LIASSALVIGGAASAATTISYTSFQAAPNPGEVIVTDFETPTDPGLLSQVIFNMSGYALIGDAELVTGSTTGVTAAPAMDATTRDATQYLAVEKGESADLTTPLLSTISFYVGSLDGWNGLTFTHQDGTTETFMGTAIDSLLTTVDASGNQVAANSNGRLSFVFSNPITGVQFTSASDSFEISNIATTMATLLPETSAWAMMVIGFGGIGGVMRKRRADQTVATA